MIQLTKQQLITLWNKLKEYDNKTKFNSLEIEYLKNLISEDYKRGLIR